MYDAATAAIITAAAGGLSAGTGLYSAATAKDPKQSGGFANVQPPPDPTRFTQNLPNILTTLQNMRRSRPGGL